MNKEEKRLILELEALSIISNCIKNEYSEEELEIFRNNLKKSLPVKI